MKRLAAMAVLALAACGGGVEFDEDAVRSHLEQRYPGADGGDVDEAVDALRDLCGADDRVFTLTVAMAVDEATDDQLDRFTIACPDRTRAALVEIDVANALD